MLTTMHRTHTVMGYSMFMGAGVARTAARDNDDEGMTIGSSVRGSIGSMVTCDAMWMCAMDKVDGTRPWWYSAKWIKLTSTTASHGSVTTLLIL